MFSESDKSEIAELVRAVEARTSGEVAVVWSARSDDYVLVRALWSLALAAVLVAELSALHFELAGPVLPALTLLVTIALYFLCGVAAVTRRLVPSAVQAERVHRQAQVAFLELGVTETDGRGGVLLFLSELEHRVEILADRGIAARVDQGVWQSVVDELISALKAGKTMPGVRRALERIGELLEREFPREAADRNELPDAPRELG